MRRLSLVIAVASAALAASALAADVPVPVKKPKDAKGHAITEPSARPSQAGQHHVTSEPQPSAAKAEPSPPAKPLEATKTQVILPPAPPVPAKTQPDTAQPAPGKDASWPKTLPEAKAEAEGSKNPAAIAIATEWAAADIDVANARCTQLLKSINAVTLPEAPFRQGDCGAPAPVRLVSIGRSPEVAISPPAVLTCDMVAALHTWMTRDLQPLAKKHLGSQIIKVESMSDYSCRNAYGRTKSKLSEHGHANALDIRGFITNEGQQAYVLAGWGSTQRDIAARIAVARAAEEKAATQRAVAEAEKAAAQKPVVAGGVTPAEPGTAADLVRSTIVEGTTPTKTPVPALGMVPAHLGGPKVPNDKSIGKNTVKVNAEAPAKTIGTKSKPVAQAEVDAPLIEPPTKMSHFLRAAHASACQIFGTTLGPEANNAHRNHFHVDMAPRTRSKICD
jgi:hypothetical protein